MLYNCDYAKLKSSSGDYHLHTWELTDRLIDDILIGHTYSCRITETMTFGN